jgi:uncharacterized protein (DUF1501 family)
MPPLEATSLDRRDFLRLGAAAGVSLLGASVATARPATAKQCIVLFLTGGPSHLETFDPKPTAPVDVRGPFRPIATSVPGIQIGEHLPRLASLAHRYALIRSLHHDAAPIHETGQQLLQTGRLSTDAIEHPHFGAVLSAIVGPKQPGVPPFVLLPGPLGNTGVNVSHGQGASFLGDAHAPALRDDVRLRAAVQLAGESETTRDRYGRTPFGDHCLQARRLVEAGVRCVTVNMFDSVFDRVTWDCHAARGFLSSSLDDYRRTLCPTLDLACAALLQDLADRGLLDETLVVVMGEFGRTPHMNSSGGRDHWPGVWSILLAGGGVRGGQVIGASDRLGAEPAQRTVSPADVVASIYQAMGIDPAARLVLPTGSSVALAEGRPICELHTELPASQPVLQAAWKL